LGCGSCEVGLRAFVRYTADTAVPHREQRKPLSDWHVGADCRTGRQAGRPGRGGGAGV